MMYRIIIFLKKQTIFSFFFKYCAYFCWKRVAPEIKLYRQMVPTVTPVWKKHAELFGAQTY